MAEIRLEGVQKTYPGGYAALHGLDLAAHDGELLVLVGPSGCGKSTTLRLIAGLEVPTAGRVLIGDRDVTTLPPQDRDIAMVFQSYALYPHKTVRENLAFPLRMRSAAATEIEEKISRVAAALDLEPLLEHKPRQLSGGQRQRVALGRAMVREPKAFLFDEPLSNLDARLRVQTRTELARMHRRLEATMVYVTHDQEEAMTLGDRVAVMHQGALQQVAPPMELYRQPANVFVATFIGSPEMNCLDCAPAGPSRVAGAGFTLDLGHALPAGAPRELLLGVRPHDIALVPSGEGDLVGRLDVVEPLGNEALMHVTLDGASRHEPMRVVSPADSAPREGSHLGLRLLRDRLHLFARGSGRRLE